MDIKAKKAEAFRLFGEGRDEASVTQATGLHRLTVFNWFREWRRKGGEPPAEQYPVPEAAPPAAPLLLVGTTWPARITRVEPYGAFAELLDPADTVVGKGLIHWTRMFAPGDAPKDHWWPAEFLPTGAQTQVRILDAGDPQRLALTTAGFPLTRRRLAVAPRVDRPAAAPSRPRAAEEASAAVAALAPSPAAVPPAPAHPALLRPLPMPLDSDLVRVVGEHSPRVVIRALETAIAALGDAGAAERFSVHIEVRRAHNGR